MMGRAARQAGTVAVALAVALASPVAAADDGVRETVVVREALALVVEPAELAYGAVDAGSASEPAEIRAQVSAPGGRAWRLSVEGSPLVSHQDRMPPSVRSVKVEGSPDWVPAGESLVVGRGEGDATVTMRWRVAVPDGQPAGTYRGTLTFVASGD